MRACALPKAAALAAFAVLVFASSAGAQPNGEDSVTGSQQIPFDGGGAAMQVDARSGPAGENPSGTFSASFSYGSGSNNWYFRDGTVTCLVVDGNEAVVVGTGTYGGGYNPFTGEPNPELERWFRLYVQDNGPPLGPFPEFGVRDVVSHDFSATEPDCSIPPVPPPPQWPLEATLGDVAVHDAPALPTTKEQCKDGGWRPFGVFRNQGDCVSYVATRGRNPAAGR
jgi:hypothetical protein